MSPTQKPTESAGSRPEMDDPPSPSRSTPSSAPEGDSVSDASGPPPESAPPTDVFEVACPSCKAILVIGRASGEVLEHRKLSDEEASTRRIQEAFDRARRSTELAEQKFAKAKEREKGKMDRLNKLFDDTMKKKVEEGDTGRPDRPFDLD